MKEEVTSLICNCLRELNQTIQSPDLENPTAETRLFGTKSPLDSLALVTLIVDVEEAISTRFGKELVLADERALSRTHSPFRRVGSLADYILEKLEN